jgi:hypothetical protein
MLLRNPALPSRGPTIFGAIVLIASSLSSHLLRLNSSRAACTQLTVFRQGNDAMIFRYSPSLKARSVSV